MHRLLVVDACEVLLGRGADDVDDEAMVLGEYQIVVTQCKTQVRIVRARAKMMYKNKTSLVYHSVGDKTSSNENTPHRTCHLLSGSSGNASHVN